MRSNRGFSVTPLISALVCAAGIAGGVVYGERHPHAQLSAVTTHGEWVKYTNAKGDSISAYVAYPERRDKAPAIIVVHEIFGMTDWEPTVADKFAAKGYVAIAPDLLSSQYKATDSVKAQATKLVSALPDAQVIGDLDATYKYVNGLVATQSGNTGIIGFCWGGGTVWKYAAANPNVKAAVPCYGPVSDTSALSGVKAPVFAVDAGDDARVTGMLPGITAFMNNHKKPFTSTVYPGMGHGFLKPGRQGNGTPTADGAMTDIMTFFDKQLQHK